MAHGSAPTHPMDAHRVDSRAHPVARRARPTCAKESPPSSEKRRPVWPDRVSTDLPAFYPWEEEPPFR
ncbi:MAG: hypothetical protein MZW92_40990 [Comamonadaceae bacterium]|nr:hypothetical protein [Comamonadaceae bacterium]